MVDAILTASFCSGVVLVSRIGKVTKTELTQATAMLSKLNVIGVVANDLAALAMTTLHERIRSCAPRKCGEIVSYPQHRMNV